MRTFKLLASALVFCALAQGAQAWPDKPITIILPFPPGGATDTTARLMAPKMTEILGQAVVIDNKPGATGAIGAGLVAAAKPDGYTLMVASIGTYAVNPFLQKDLRYDPQKDFDLLTVAVRTPNVLVANPNFPANSVADLVAQMKKNPGQVTFASSGSGSSDHLTAALFMQRTGATGNHVPYKGGAPAISDLIGGHVDVSFQNLGAIINHVKSGKLKALGMSGEKRDPLLPNAPTMAEAGYQDIVVYSWQAMAAPKGLPADVKAKLNQAIQGALKSPEVVAKFTEIGFDVVASSNDEFAKFLGDELARWKRVIEEGNITAQ